MKFFLNERMNVSDIFDHIKIFKKLYTHYMRDIFTKFTLMQLFWRCKQRKVHFYSSSYAIFMIRMIFDTSSRKHESAHPSSSVILFSLFRPDIGNKWISFPVTLVRRFILSRINARADLSFARIRFVADL